MGHDFDSATNAVPQKASRAQAKFSAYERAGGRDRNCEPYHRNGRRSSGHARRDPDPFPRHSLRHAVYAALLHFGFETALDNNTFHDGGFSSTLPAQDVLWRGSADGNTLDAAMIAALNGGTELSVILQGRDGDDTLIGSSLNDTLDGGNGSDTAQGYDASFHLALDSGHWVVTNGADETDTLLGVERVVIDGKTYLLVDKLGDGTGGYQSVQAAIDAANAGDTILVAAGIYPENLNIDTSGLTIRNAPGETVIINGQVNGLAGAINVGTGISVTIESDSPANLVVNAPSGVGQAAALYLVGNNDGSSISGVTLHLMPRRAACHHIS